MNKFEKKLHATYGDVAKGLAKEQEKTKKLIEKLTADTKKVRQEVRKAKATEVSERRQATQKKTAVANRQYRKAQLMHEKLNKRLNVLIKSMQKQKQLLQESKECSQKVKAMQKAMQDIAKKWSRRKK